MPIPYIFQPNEQADAIKVNENFAFILSLIGEFSTPDRVKTPTEFLMGFRQNTLLTGTHDTGAQGFKFFQIGYNADWNFSGGAWTFARLVSGEASSALRIGAGYVDILLTSETSGSLNSQMTKRFRIVANDGNDDDYMYLDKEFHIKGRDTASESAENYRLTTTFFASPKAIFNAQSLQKGIEVYRASNYGIPANAKTVLLSTDLSTNDGHFRCYQERSDRHWKYGFVSRDGGQGMVLLGTGSYAGKFVIERTGAITSGSVFVVGYGI